MRSFDDEDPELDDDFDLDDLDPDFDFDLDIDTDFDKRFDFDDELPELDLSDLDLYDDPDEPVSRNKSPKKELIKYEDDDDFDFDGLNKLIKAEAFRAIDIDDKPMLPSKYLLDEDADNAEYFDYTEDDFEDDEKKPKKKHTVLTIVISIVILLMASAAFLVFTPYGRKVLYKIAGSFIASHVNKEEEAAGDGGVVTGPGEDAEPTYYVSEETRTDIPTIYEKEDEEQAQVIERNESKYRSEDYVKTYLLFGIEEIDGAANTDAILLLSVNTKDNTIKLTSLLRDTYVEIPGYYGNKINSVYAHGMKSGETTEERKRNGANLLMNVIEETYDIEITGYLSINFKNFENIVNYLGGIDLQLGRTEASYLRTTNYISNPAYRTVVEGWNHMNGNQVLGYCRVRKVVTLGGYNNDYGRTVRHRRVISAIIEQYKSLSYVDMYKVACDCLAYVSTDLTEDQFAEMIENVVENKTYTIEQMRLPLDNMFKDSGKKGKNNGKYNVTYAILLDGYEEANIKKFHEFVFLDEPEEETVTQ